MTFTSLFLSQTIKILKWTTDCRFSFSVRLSIVSKPVTLSVDELWGVPAIKMTSAIMLNESWALLWCEVKRYYRTSQSRANFHRAFAWAVKHLEIVGEWIFLWLLPLYCTWAWWLRVCVFVYAGVCKQKRRLFHHFCPAHTDCLFKIVSPHLRSPLILGAAGGDSYGRYPVSALTVCALNAHHTWSKHDRHVGLSGGHVRHFSPSALGRAAQQSAGRPAAGWTLSVPISQWVSQPVCRLDAICRGPNTRSVSFEMCKLRAASLTPAAACLDPKQRVRIGWIGTTELFKWISLEILNS